MYIQPYEPQQSSFASQQVGRRDFSDTSYPSDVSGTDGALGSDGVSQSPPWSQMLSDAGDAAGALDDGPLPFGLGGMLSSLTGMMQQLAQMIQALVERASGGDEPAGQQQTPMSPSGHRHAHGMSEATSTGCGCGCTQQAQSLQSP